MNMKVKRPIGIFSGIIALCLMNPAIQAGSIKGKVVFDGISPAPKEVAVKSDTSVCGTHQKIPAVVVGDSGGIRFAVVRLLAGSSALPKPKPADGSLDQIQCQFEPHAQIVPVGSKLVITSSDAVLHNAHGFDEKGETLFNIAVPVKGMKVAVELKKPGRIKLRCDAGHNWMIGYIIVAEHPYYAVTDTTGSFELKDVPAGAYTVEVWQENMRVQQQKVTVADDGTADLKFTFSESSLSKAKK